MMDSNGFFGPWTVPGPALSPDEIANLPDGTEVEIVWSGGNGPHRYFIAHDPQLGPCVITAAGDDAGALSEALSLIGPQPLTEVRRV